MLLSEDTTLLVIDIQQRLATSMPDDDMERCLHATTTLVELAGEVGANIVYTEQYPDGLGSTVEELRQTLKDQDASRVEKTSFDACSAPEFHDILIDLPKRIVVCGMETHVCVYTTVRELLSRHHEVVVPFDATISRRPSHHDNGLSLMREAGATVANYETIVFDALQNSKHPAFKKFSALIR